MSKKIGLLLRSYAKTDEDVPSVVERAVKSITVAYGLRFWPLVPVFGAIVVLVPCDHDCKKTANAILRTLPHYYIDQNVYVVEVLGHHSCGALNDGMDILATLGMDYSVVVSNKAIESLTADTMEVMTEAFEKGAKAVGVAVDELQGAVLTGRIQNTFSGWDIKALREIGGFDSEIGVEEIAPTVRLIQKYGPCIAVLHPHDVPPLDIRKSAEGEARHAEVMNTKIERQIAEVKRLDVDFSFIKSGIMPGYPITV